MYGSTSSLADDFHADVDASGTLVSFGVDEFSRLANRSTSEEATLKTTTAEETLILETLVAIVANSNKELINLVVEVVGIVIISPHYH